MILLALGTFVPPTAGTAGSFDPRVPGHRERPLIVVVREFRPDFVTKRFPKPKDVVIVDIVDVAAQDPESGQSGTVHISVIWGSGPIVDRLKGSVAQPGQTPEKLPVKVVEETSAAGNKYYVVEPLDDKFLQLAVNWDAKFPTRIDDERAAAAEKASVDSAAKRYDDAADNPAADSVSPIQGLGAAQPDATTPAATPAEPAGGISQAELDKALDELS